MSKSLTFLKLGGSLITQKDQPATARAKRIASLAGQIAAARRADPQLRILLGHGSGSFGHVPAKAHSTREGVKDGVQWRGFAEVWRQAAALNHIVMGALDGEGLPAVAFPPSASAMAEDGQISRWDTAPIESALAADLLPVVYGDAAFDSRRGGTILSTEDLFVYLANVLGPQRVLLAANEPIYADYESRKGLVKEIHPGNLEQIRLGAAESPDVTGGMASKVAAMLKLAKRLPNCEIRIFAAAEPGSLEHALLGREAGTLIRAG